jgi:glycosyltransferase involved in cell wall biosynthesis
VRSALHVLPHPGGGGETYVDLLERMDGYRFERLFLAASPLERRPDRLLAGAARAAVAARKHDIVHVHGEGAAYLSLAALAWKPSLVTLHGLNVLRRSEAAWRPLAVASLRVVVAAADRTICVSETEHQEVEDALGPREKIVLVRNGVFMPVAPGAGTREAVRRELGISEDAVVALAVGGLEPVKDPLTAARAAIAAASGADDLVLCFAGDGPLAAELGQLGGDVVRLLGRRDDLDRIYTAADILVVASKREGMSFATLEAMAHGLALVVADGPGCAEAPGDAAVVARAGNPGSFADWPPTRPIAPLAGSGEGGARRSSSPPRR